MLVNQHTKIAAILKHHPEAMDTIASISPKFEKLRNPFLRKLMAGRVSISMAAKIGGCREEDFLRVLKPLGFTTVAEKGAQEKAETEMPLFLRSVKAEQIIELDVRPLLEAGNDPLKLILAKVKALKQGEVLKIINTFEPTPLIAMLDKKGFSSFTQTISPQHIETLFFRESAAAVPEPPAVESKSSNEGWEQVKERFAGKMEEIDVRELEMPLPMTTILESLDTLPEGYALFVHHKRLPVFLLPELDQRHFDYRSNALSDNQVQLLIFRKKA